MRRALTLALTTALVLGGGAALALGDVLDEYTAGSASSVEIAAVTALPTIQRDLSDFTRPIDPSAATVEYDGPNLTGLSAVAMEVDGTGFAGMSSMEEVTGPNGGYLTRIGFEINGSGDPGYYSTNQWATLYLAEFDGEPVAPDGGVLGISLAWNWPGQEGLTVTPFPNDPMLGFANNAEEGTVGGEPFRAFYSVADGAWNQYENQVLSFSGPVKRDRTWFFGWVVPGVPETAAATLSYATDPADPGTLISQQLTFETQLAMGFPELAMRYSDLPLEQRLSLDEQWALHATGTTVSTDTEPDDHEEQGVLVDGAKGGGEWYKAYEVWFGLGLLFLVVWYLSRRAKGGVRAIRPPRPRDESDGPAPEDEDPIDMGGSGVIPS